MSPLIAPFGALGDMLGARSQEAVRPGWFAGSEESIRERGDRIASTSHHSCPARWGFPGDRLRNAGDCRGGVNGEGGRIPRPGVRRKHPRSHGWARWRGVVHREAGGDDRPDHIAWRRASLPVAVADWCRFAPAAHRDHDRIGRGVVVCECGVVRRSADHRRRLQLVPDAGWLDLGHGRPRRQSLVRRTRRPYRRESPLPVW